MFLNHFNVLMLKIIFFKKKYYFDTFLNKNTLKNNRNHTFKYTVIRVFFQKKY